jgi:hypothetical protein
MECCSRVRQPPCTQAHWLGANRGDGSPSVSSRVTAKRLNAVTGRSRRSLGLVARGVQQVILEQLAWGVRLGEGGHRLEGVRPLVQRVHPLLERLGRCTMSPRSESRWE